MVFTIGYILQLESGKYYVGISDNINFRLEMHFNGNGSSWTKLHKPVKVLLLKAQVDKRWEKHTTLIMMRQYGWENVRGGAWCQRNLKKAPKWMHVSSQEEAVFYLDKCKEGKTENTK